jgi:hypothetical protein
MSINGSSGKGPVLVYFSPARIALNMELKNHPELMEQMAEIPMDDFTSKIAKIAAFCNIAVDGDYTEDDLDGLATVCYSKLTEIRKIVFH